MNQIKIVGMDPSLSNWGVAKGLLDIDTGVLDLQELSVIKPSVIEAKQVRTNVKDLDRANQLVSGALEAVRDADVICVEVPTGSQSASAMKGYGICIGALAALEVQGHSFILVTPTQVKEITGLGKTATKKAMIEWASNTYPDAPWPRQTVKGVTSIVAGTAEHMSDAVAAIHAGVATPEFKRLLPAFRRAAQ